MNICLPENLDAELDAEPFILYVKCYAAFKIRCDGLDGDTTKKFSLERSDCDGWDERKLDVSTYVAVEA